MDEIFFVGTYTEPILFGTGQVLEGQGKGIYACTLDLETGATELLSVTEGIRNPSYLAFDPESKFLYAVNELKEFEGTASGAVSAFAFDKRSGKLTLLNTQPSHGTDPCHLTVDRTGKHVLVANFASGSVSVYPVQSDGSLGRASDVVQHEGSSLDPVRQGGPHAHAVTLDHQGKFVYVPDLGLDQVFIYALNTERGTLKSVGAVRTQPGAGPRQLVMHPSKPCAYLINELNSMMTSYAYDEATGELSELQTLSTLPLGFEGASTCAEVQIAPNGAFLYGSNRGHDSVVVYATSEDGTLILRGHESTGGEIPRNIIVSPKGDYLLAANQDTQNLVVFKLDVATGMPVATGESLKVPTPVCVKFI